MRFDRKIEKYGNCNIEVLEWITLVTEILRDGIISHTINNSRRYRFDKKEYRRIENNFFNDL